MIPLWGPGIKEDLRNPLLKMKIRHIKTGLIVNIKRTMVMSTFNSNQIQRGSERCSESNNRLCFVLLQNP